MEIVSLPQFINSTRDSGYRGTSSALAELVDNAIEAGASKISIKIEKIESSPYEIVVTVMDNGVGMSPVDLMVALQFGGSKRFNNRTGLGRYGMGLPNSSVSQCKRLEVITWTSKKEVYRNYLDVDEITNNQLRTIQNSYRDRYFEPPTDSGTAVYWSKCDRLSFKSLKALLRNLHSEFGRIFRKTILKGVIIDVNGQVVKPFDPLFICKGVNLQGGKPYGEKLQYEINLPNSDASSIIGVQFIELPIAEWHNLTNDEKRLNYITKRAGVSIVRSGREIDYGWYFMGDKRKENYDDWWRCEIEFSADLDELFGVTHTKQEIHPSEYLKHLISPDLELIAKKLNSRVREEFIKIKASQPHFPLKKQLERNDHFLEPPGSNQDIQPLTSQRIQGRNGKLKVKDLIYNLAYDEFNTTEFFRLNISEDEIQVVINKKHPFYHRIYMRLGKEPENIDIKHCKEITDILIFSFARACSLVGSMRSSKRHMATWGKVLAAFLS